MRFRVALSAALLSVVTVPLMAQYPPPPPQSPPPGYRWGHPKVPSTGACFYKDAYFNGEYFCMKLGQNWPSMPSGFNDKISSIRLFNGAQVRIFNDNNFSGVNSRINRDVQNLKQLMLPSDTSKSWNDRISSLAVYRANDSWDRGHP